MSKTSESLLKGAKEALAYAKGKKTGTRTSEIKIAKKINAKRKSKLTPTTQSPK